MFTHYNFNKSVIFALVTLALFAGLLSSCDKDEVFEPITIDARIPESVVLKDSFSMADTLFFHIESVAKISSVTISEGNLKHIELNYPTTAEQKYELDIAFLYNPKETGLKSMVLTVDASEIIREYPFTILVVEE